MAIHLSPQTVAIAPTGITAHLFTNIVHWNQPGCGGHFAAWEQPSLFIDEVRAVARSCRPVPR
jgi:hypothetical protein